MAIAEDVGYNPVTFQALFSASNTGVLAYRDAAPGAQLVWFDRSGLRLAAVGPPGEYNALCMTPDGRRVVYEQADAASGNIDMWTMDLATAATTQLTFGGPVEFYPACAPNSRDIALAVLKPSNPNLFRQSLSAPGQLVPLFESPLPKLPTDWSRDGTQLIFSELNPATGWDVASLSLATGQPRPLLTTPAQEQQCQAVARRAVARLCVQREPPSRGLRAGDGRTAARNGWCQEAAACSRSGAPMAGSSITSRWTNASWPWTSAPRARCSRPSSPVALMETRFTEWETSGGSSYAVAPDGSRVLVNTSTDNGRAISLMQNWTARVR